MSNKTATAYRTISEVADMVGVKPHVLRFWEKKFSQIKPLKRPSGRRYYRPEDVRVIEQIRDLLHRQGYTVRGVQQLFKQKGVKVFQLRDESLEFGTMTIAQQNELMAPDDMGDKTQSGIILTPEMQAKLQSLYDNIGQSLQKYPS
ncbi:MAG: MerR family transcriptional regulator [Alphaproteobacteria bacterium]|nr:MerR family transcriptional regulator [Alphaproteobacteria bacterium]